MINRNCLLIFLGFSLLFYSCDILRDSPYMVKAWTPGGGYHDDPRSLKISLLFSHESDRVKTEQAFSFSEDGKTLKGTFVWEGQKLVFLPSAPLEAGRNYTISLGTGAQNIKGISLEDKFEVSFTTRPPGEKTRIIRAEPDDGGTLSGSRGEFRLFFSEPVSLNSCIDYISFNPSTPGSWYLENENKTACFVPREPWQAGTVYRVKVESRFTGLSGSILGTEYLSVFNAGPDMEKPELLKALALFPGAEAINISLGRPGQIPSAEYAGWESFTRLELVFSEPVDLSGLRQLLVCEPAATLVMESTPGISDRAVFRFAEYPQWGSSFLFRLSSGVKDPAGNQSDEEYLFRIKTAGPLSKPPVLIGIRLPLAPGLGGEGQNLPETNLALSFTPGDLFSDLPIKSGEGHYPFMEATPSWIELYFETAVETEIDPISVMDHFRVESTNQALIFTPRSIKTENFRWLSPRPGWENFQRIEIRGDLTNTVQNGVVTFRISPGLKDKRGNTNTEDFRIPVLK